MNPGTLATTAIQRLERTYLPQILVRDRGFGPGVSDREEPILGQKNLYGVSLMTKVLTVYFRSLK